MCLRVLLACMYICASHSCLGIVVSHHVGTVNKGGTWWAGPAVRTVSALTAEQSFLPLAPLVKVNRNVGSALDGCSE